MAWQQREQALAQAEALFDEHGHKGHRDEVEGKTIRGITEATGVSIDIEEDGLVTITSFEGGDAEKAKEIIQQLTMRLEPGQILKGIESAVKGRSTEVYLSGNGQAWREDEALVVGVGHDDGPDQAAAGAEQRAFGGGTGPAAGMTFALLYCVPGN